MTDTQHVLLREQRAALLDIPFPDPVNSTVEQARWHTLEWLTGSGLLAGARSVKEYDALRLERLMAYFYPEAGAHDLAVAADLNAWFFVFDDQFDNSELGRAPARIGPLVETLMRALSDGPPPPAERSAGALSSALRDVWVRASAGMPEHWRRRFRGHWHAYLSAYEAEAAHRTAAVSPTLPRFLAVRRHSIGVQPCLDLAERCCGFTLPDAVHRALPLAVLRELTADVVLFVNDVLSLEKELAAGDVNNSVLVLRARTGCDLPEAVRRTTRLANARVARFQELAAALPGFLEREGLPEPVRRNTARYTEAMRHLMRGNLSWSLETPRYAHAATDTGAVPWAGLL
ncbi:isoafricanol synthase [Streptomyces boncukensis]|uniref:Terpene synthase n=1 Tax=Streptomyces boncukensis TaxID=2711219 RepID=A0A6G4WZ82_9ACTN|nr:isoafricanol synthase [Streptomyces boncukensis]NGO69917.1 pentalenene synthase [Streptomyces boncukensis]